MAFATPGFLWALTALAIPILIHLFQLRRFKRLDFPNVHLLKDLSERSRARRKLRHLAVLLARCAALAFLVLAFARPYLPGRDPGPADGARTIALYIDNSFSMDGENANGRLLDQARAMASDVISTYDPK
ncbi:MAG: BatA domain-containing protein, partial [Flavobacteriales bacterium]|nr:BatA domain-containing protein [Flavobacteriales bacterium]